MTLEEDLALIRLRDQLRTQAPPFRVAMMQLSAKVEAASENERRVRQDERRSGTVDKMAYKSSNDYWQAVRQATEPSTLFRPEVETYNVLKDRKRPPPPQEATLPYEY